MENTLLYRASRIVTESASFREASQRILDTICQCGGWPEAHIYRVRREALELVPVWFDRRWVRLEQIRKLVTSRDGRVGTPLARLVLQSGRPQLVTEGSGVEILQKKVSPQIRQAMALPVIRREQVFAILEFFSDRQLRLDKIPSSVLQQVAALLGLLFEPAPPDQAIEAEPAEQGDATATAPGSHEGFRVFLVSGGELEKREELRQMLEELGCQVEISDSAEEALERLAAQDFDLVLMDLKLAGMGGHRAVQTMRAQDTLKHQRVLALTRQTLPDMKTRVREAGFNGFLTLPIKREELAAQIRRYTL